MRDNEFDVLDELYFLQPFEELLTATNMSEPVCADTLQQLVNKKWVNYQKSASEILATEEVDFKDNYRIYYYLASKKACMPIIKNRKCIMGSNQD